MPVLDASVVVDWVAPDSDPEGPARRLLDRFSAEAASIQAPRLLLSEVANALLTGIRRGRWDGAAADTSFVLLRSLPAQLQDETVDLARAYELSRRFDEHPIYDMLYVAMAERLGEQLYTADSRLASRVGAFAPVVLVV